MDFRDWLRGRAERRRHLYRREFSLPRDRGLLPDQPAVLERIERAIESVRGSCARLGSSWWGASLLGAALIVLFWAVGRDPAFPRWAIGFGGAGCLVAGPVLFKLRNVAFALPLAGFGVGERIEALLGRVTMICAVPLAAVLGGAGVLAWRRVVYGLEPPGPSIYTLCAFGLPVIVMTLQSWFLLRRYGEQIRDIDAQLGAWSGRDAAAPEVSADPFLRAAAEVPAEPEP